MKNTDYDTALAGLYALYHEDWVVMAEHGLGHFTWSKQREIIYSVQRNKKTAVRASHGSSKTFSAAEIAVIFYNLFPESVVITTAPSYDQVDLLLWKEIRKIYKDEGRKNIRLSGKCYDGACYIVVMNRPEHYVHGFSTDRATRAEGFHAWDILYIFDEAKGIPAWMWDSAKGALGSGNSKWLVISTTDGVEIGSPFHKCFLPGSDWNQIAISAYDTPYYTGEKFKRIVFPDPLNLMNYYREEIAPEDARIQIHGRDYIEASLDPVNGWGKDSPLFLTKVEGKICDLGADSIIRLSQTRKMFENYNMPDFDASGGKRGGIDLAWGGMADTVAWKAEGLRVLSQPLVIKSKDLPEIELIKYQCDMIESYFGHDKEFQLKIDVTGGGIGVTSEMQSRGWKVTPINNAWDGTKLDKGGKKLYQKIIDEMWFEVAKIVQDIACPNIPRLEMELVQRKTKGLNSKGQMVVERKEDYIKRGFRSPDFADSFLLTFYNFSGRGVYVGQSKEDFY